METRSALTISSLLEYYTGTYSDDCYYKILKKRFNHVTDKSRQPGLYWICKPLSVLFQKQLPKSLRPSDYLSLRNVLYTFIALIHLYNKLSTLGDIIQSI